MVIDGRKIALGVMGRLKKEPIPEKFLAAFLVGDDKNSESFLKQKEKTAKELGVDFRIRRFPENTSEKELKEEISKTVGQKECGGAIVQLPLPPHIDRQSILNAIPPKKDVDVLNERSPKDEILPPAVGVVKTILGIMNKELGIMNVIVIGAGLLVGRPVSSWLENKVAGLSVFDEFTKDLRNKLKDADIIISGVGKANLFGAEDLKNEALVIDFGYDFSGGRIHGDFSPIIHDSKFLIHYTPTPGGTGPILVAKLFENFYKLNEKDLN